MVRRLSSKSQRIVFARVQPSRSSRSSRCAKVECGSRLIISAGGHLTEQQLAELPVDRLKIASECLPSSVGEAGKAGEGAAALAIIRVAKELGLDLSAECVETEAQRDFLLENGCRVMQGYYFAKPMTPLAAALLLREGHIDS